MIVGAFGCLHLPFERDGYIDWMLDVFKKNKVKKVIIVGDLVDNHIWSRHANHPEAMGGMSEYDITYTKMQELKEKLKKYKVTWVLGNHDDIPARHLESMSLPPHIMLKSYQDMWNVPKWEVCHNYECDGVNYVHGIGTKSTLLSAQRLRQSFVSAHYHSMADIQTHVSWKDRIFGMHIGSGVDDRSYAMAYNKYSLNKSVISCATIKDGTQPQLHYMEL